MAKIKGKWRWNSTVRALASNEEITYSVRFTTDDSEPSSFSKSKLIIKGQGYGSLGGYNVNSGSVSDPFVGYVPQLAGTNIFVLTSVGIGGYLNFKEDSRIINFGQAEQEISDELFDYILHNATLLVPEFLIQRDTLTATADSIRKYLDKNQYSFSSTVIYGVVPDAICALLYECIDATEPEREGIHESHDTAKFDAVGYEQNNEGIVVPVLYEFIDADIVVDKYFYIETVSSSDMGLQGEELLDKWRKIEMIPAGEDETGFSTWESTERQYVYTTHIITTNEATTTINPLNFPDQIAEVYAAGVATVPTYKNANEEVY
jgi:hypothetical protein